MKFRWPFGGRESGRGWAASPSLTAIAIGVLVVVGPFLVLPELAPPPLRSPVVVTATLVAFVLAVALLGPASPPGLLVGVLILTIIQGWLRATPSPEALSHFAGAGAGLLAMGVLASWCRTEGRLALAVALFVVLGSGVLTVGLLGAPAPKPKLLEPDEFALSLPRLKLGLPGLGASGYVNPNALAGAALLIAPVSVALVFAFRWRARAGKAVSLLAALSAVLAFFAIYFSQSRSAWLAAWLTLLVLVLRVGRRWAWRVVALGGVLALLLGVVAGLSLSGTETSNEIMVRARLSAEKRVAPFLQGVEHVKASPLSGIGLNEFRRVYKWPNGGRHGDIAHAHNIFLQTALDLGLVGLAAYVGLSALLLIQSDQAARGPFHLAALTAAGAGLCLVGVHLFGLADAIPLGAKVGLFQWLAGGLILAAWRVQRADRKRHGLQTSGESFTNWASSDSADDCRHAKPTFVGAAPNRVNLERDSW